MKPAAPPVITTEGLLLRAFRVKAALASLTVTSGTGAGGTVTAGTPYTVGDVGATSLKAN